jgi:KDO2-lipid IV(A) lauroyltransferase
VLGLTIDQRPHLRGRKTHAEFLGRPTALCSTAAVLSLRTGAPLLLALTHREPGGRHVIRITEPLAAPSLPGPVRDRVDALARTCHGRIEQAIADNPDQWLWFHRRWVPRGSAA